MNRRMNRRMDDRSEATSAPSSQRTSAAGATTLLTAEDVAAQLRVRAEFVYELARNGKLRFVRLGARYVRFRQRDVDDYVEVQTTAGGGPRVAAAVPLGRQRRRSRSAAPRGGTAPSGSATGPGTGAGEARWRIERRSHV